MLRIAQRIWNDISEDIHVEVNNQKGGYSLSCPNFFYMTDEEFEKRYLEPKVR